MRNLQISNIDLTLTLILTSAKLRSAFCELCRLTNCAQQHRLLSCYQQMLTPQCRLLALGVTTQLTIVNYMYFPFVVINLVQNNKLYLNHNILHMQYCSLHGAVSLNLGVKLFIPSQNGNCQSSS